MMALMRDLRSAFHLGPERRAALARAAFELGMARLHLGSRHVQRIMNAANGGSMPSPLSRQDAHVVELVSFAIPRAARRLPWRADCLVQALAAERWLRHKRIAARLVIGVDKESATTIDAHAWLLVGDRIVTGGDVARFASLNAPGNRGPALYHPTA